MRKIKETRLMLIVLAVLCLCIYACYDGVDFPSGKSSRSGKLKKKNKELTTAIARQWFEANMTPVVTMRSSEAKDVQAAMVKPKWEDAYEANRGKYEVVQTPILMRGKRIFVDAETQKEFEKIRGQKYLRNAARMVIRKDLRTGEIRSFITVFVGSLEYMKKSKKMGRNSYLYKESDFDGKVLFFEPNGGLINGWKYRNGKIVAKIMPLSEDAKFFITRGWVEECHTEIDFEVEKVCHDEVSIEPDEEFGEAWVVESICEDITTPIEYQVCEEEWEEDEDNGDSGIGDGDGISGDVDPTENEAAPKAKKLFQNKDMPVRDWKFIEERLDSIMKDCMGKGLYNSLVDSLKGKHISFQFSTKDQASFNPQTNMLQWNRNMDSNQLFHELMHAYQYQNEKSFDSWKNAIINMEIETHYAHYLYIKGSSEYGGSDWEKGSKGGDSRILSIIHLEDYVDNKGNLIDGMIVDLLDTYLEFHVVTAFKQDANYGKYSYDESRSSLSNFSNLNKITKDC